MSTDLSIVDFITARLVDDERLAIALRDLMPASWRVVAPLSPMARDIAVAATALAVEFDHGRVLREVAAKRQILADHQPTLTTVEWWHDQTDGGGFGLTCPTCRPEEPHTWTLPIGEAGVKPDGWVESYILAPCPTLRALASVWAGHDSFRAEWSVTE